ncbi:MAG: DNA polymerase eta-like [Trebouxia sp. A1-2]|nr:MAG: DNA polymerase eta-like [Trebouxia sp. A1-2]
MSSASLRQLSTEKAVIHCDVDCFYCQVEVLDNPALAARPLAVHQGNSGGFVAVNYQEVTLLNDVETGQTVRRQELLGSDVEMAQIPTTLLPGPFIMTTTGAFKRLGNFAPALLQSPCGSDLLQQVSAQVLALISQHATNGQCEKTSYDDFYLEVLPDAAKLSASDAWIPPSSVDLHILGGTGFHALPPILKWGAQVACNIRALVQQELALTMSFGIAVGKLSARLAGPLHKPSGMTIVPPNQAAAFLLDTPILKVPHLRGQLGKQVVEQLSVEHVRDLAAYQARELTDMFGTAVGQLLFDLGHCIDDKRVQAKGPQQNICCTKSYHGLRDFARVDEALQRLVYALWPRLLEERSSSGRVPVKLKLGLKQRGREQQVRSYTLSFPQAAAKQLQATAVGSVDSSAIQSSAVHTLIPNLAPRSRLQHPSLAKGIPQQLQSGSASKNNKQLDALPMQAKRQLLESAVFQDPADNPVKLPNNSGQDHVQNWLESGVHQAARCAIFQAALGLLKPKLVQPVMVNFMSVGGEYTKDARPGGNHGGMLRFLQPASASSCEAALLAGHCQLGNGKATKHDFADNLPLGAEAQELQSQLLPSELTEKAI